MTEIKNLKSVVGSNGGETTRIIVQIIEVEA